MDIMTDYAKKLAEAVHAGELYERYKKNRLLVAKNPALEKRLIEYKKKQAEIENKRVKGEEVSFDDEKLASHLYAEITRNKTLGDFLSAEESYLDAYLKIFGIIDEAFEIERFI